MKILLALPSFLKCFSLYLSIGVISLLFLPHSALKAQSTMAQSKISNDLDGSSWLPTKEGTRIEYNVELRSSNDPQGEPRVGTYELHVFEIHQERDSRVSIVRERDSFTERFRYSTWTQSENDLSISGVSFSGPLAISKSGHLTTLLRWPIEENEKIDDGQWITQFRGIQEIKIPLFNETLKTWRIDVIGTLDRAYTIVGTFWMYPGLGIVKASYTTPGWHIEHQIIAVE